MKTKLNKIFAFLLIAFIGLSTFTASAAKVYFKPSEEWKSDKARFAAYFYKNSSTYKWVGPADNEYGCGVYEFDVPSGYKYVIFCRMNPSTTANNWNNKWTQTGDLTIPTNGNNFYVVSGWDSGSWGKLEPGIKILGLGGKWDWKDGKSFESHTGDEVKYMCLEVKDSESIKVVRNQDCYYGKGYVKDTSVSVSYDSSDNIVLSKGVYDLYFDKTTNQLYIGNATPTKAYLIGVEGSEKIEMPLNSAKTEFVLTNQLVKSTDNVKVLLEWSCGATLEYVALEGAVNCSSVKSATSGITMGEGYYDFYFKVSSKELYLEANKENPANQKYVLMGVGADWTNGIELQANPSNADELMLLNQPISKASDAVKVVMKNPCNDDFYAVVSASTTVPYTGGGSGSAAPNIVLEDGIYNFFFNKTTGAIRIDGTLDDARIVYLDPVVYNAENSGTWTSDDARIALYAYQSNGGTKNLWTTAIRCGEIYYAYLPLEYDMYIWCRMNPAKDENKWNPTSAKDYVWNQTAGIAYDAANQLTKLTGWADKDDKVHYQEPYKGTCGINYDDIECDFPELKGDTLFVTINKFVESDPCNYLFESFEQAFAVLKKNTEICDASKVYYGSFKQDAITLRKPVVMQVVFGPEPYRGTEVVGMSGGHIGNAPAIFIRNINMNGEGKPLIIRTADKGNRAVIVHPVIRRSTNITLDNLDIISDTELRDNAIDIDTGEGAENLEGLGGDFNVVPYSTISHNITLKNSKYISYGRNCIHVVGINGIHVENNEFYTKYDFSVDPTEGEDVVDWGGTIKFINTENVKFLRNNSEGTLATSFFIQGCRKVLLMNNVFWNDNAVSVPQLAEGNRTVANVRLVNYGTKASEFPIKNIGIYYNTFFIKNNPSTELAGSYVKFDFFRLGGKEQPVDDSNKDNFDPTTIRFQYNNCYSYDEDIEGNNDVYNENTKLTYYLQGIGQNTAWCQCFKYNNFWSEYDKIKKNKSSSFELGKFCTNENETYNLYENVKDQVCKTDPQQPAALVVKGTGLNIGTVISEAEDVSEQGAHLIFNDRVNPENGVNSIRPQMAVDNKPESLSPYDKIYLEPGSINLYTSPIVGSQTTDVMLTSIKLTANKNVNLSVVDDKDQRYEEGIFALTNSAGESISYLTTDANGSIDNKPVYVTFIRPDIDEDKSYEAFLKIVPSQDADAQLILRIPLRGHYKAELATIGGAWTVGAFQQREASPVDTIIWHGLTSSEWDDRNNWYKTDGTLVTCLDALTENLTVILPAKDSEKYLTPVQGVVQYPVLPIISDEASFNARKEQWHGEQVNAGDNGTTQKVVSKIFMEYGASLIGVEGLNASTGANRYDEVDAEFIARRSEWLLVGPVVKPWGEAGAAREMVSGDFYVANQLPHVYMHQAQVDGSTVTWDESFAPLDVPLYGNTVFAIRIPNQYGPKKHTATRYNRDNGTTFDPKEPINYNFVGRFYNDAKLPTYEGLTPTVSTMLTNTYPAAINAYMLQKDKGSVQYYDYEECSFVPVAEDNQDVMIMPQHGFVFTPGADRYRLEIQQEYMLNTEVGHRSAAEDVTSFRLALKNKKASTGSQIYVRIDELKEDVAEYTMDAPKVFNGKETTLGDLYAIRYDKNWAGVVIPTVAEPIPLGVKVNANNQIFTFSLESTSVDFDVLLEDRQKGEVYNLSAGENYVVDDLVKGNSEGRFYLLLSEKAEEDTPEEGGDVTTDASDVESIAGGIDIFTQSTAVVVSATSDIELQQVIISDVAGRHQVYNVSGQYVKLDLPVNTGVYTISVIGDKQTRVEKIKLN